MPNRPLRAIDISFSGVRWVEVSAGPDGAELQRWGVLAGAKADTSGDAALPGLPEADALAGLFSQSPSRSWRGGRGVFLSLPSSLSTARLLRLPPTGEDQVRSAVEFEVREALEIEGDGLYWDFLSASEDGGETKGVRVLAVATLAERLQPYLQRLREAGLEVQRIVPEGLASFWGLQVSLEQQTDGDVLLLDIGPMESVLTLGNHREVLGTRSVPAGSRYSRDTFWREVGRTVEFFRQRFGATSPQTLYVVGEAEPEGLGECLELAGIELRRFHPGEGLRSLAVSGDLYHEELSRFAAPLGLVAAELGDRAQINLLPRREKKAAIPGIGPAQLARVARRSWPVVLLAALMAGTWAFGPTLLHSARRSRLKQAGEVAARIGDLGREKDWLDRIAKERVNWSELFYGLSDAVPGDVNITEISFNEDAEVRIVASMGGNLAKLAEFIGKLEENQVLKDTRIEKSQSEERKLNFVISAKKGTGKPPKTEEKKETQGEAASAPAGPEEKPPGEKASAEKPPETSESSSRETGEAKPSPPTTEEVKAQPEQEPPRVRSKEEVSGRVRESRSGRRSSRGSRSTRIIMNGKEIEVSPNQEAEDVVSGGGP
jgi:Tfp pilus assembly PilM family ATPase